MFTRNICALKTIPLAAVLAACAGNAVADSLVWTGAAGDLRFNTPGNWNIGRVPQAGDTAYITAPRSTTIVADGGIVGHLYCDASLIITTTGSFHIYGDSDVWGEFLMVGNRLDVIGGTLSLHADYNVWQRGQIYTVANSVGTIHLMPGSYMQIGGIGPLLLGCNLINDGTVDFTKGQVSFYPFGIGGSYVNNLVIDNKHLWRNATGTSISQADYGHNLQSFVFNEGGWSYEGSAGSCSIGVKTSLWNPGGIDVGPGVEVTFDNITNIDNVTGALYSGTWAMYGGVIHTNRDITSIEKGASVSVVGSGSFMDGLTRVQTIKGTLFVDGGADVTLAPFSLNTLQNYGTLAVGAGSHLRVNAGYWQHPGATLRRFIDNSGPTPLVGTFDTLLSSTVGGDLSVEFYSDNLTPGQEFSMIQMAPSACCGVSGTFENVSVSSNGTHRVVTRYDADAVKAVVPVCPSDFDGDGFVTGDDFDSFVDEFQAGKAAADFDSDGFVTGDDFDAYVEAFELGC